MCGCSMALRYDDRGSNFSKPYYNGKSGAGNAGSGKDRAWNNSGDGGRYGNEFRESTSTSADHYSRKYERRETTSGSRNQENWDDRSNAGDSDKAQLKQVGDWTEQLSSAGKKYYYNCRTEVSQWEKPAEWVAWERRSGQDQNRKKRPEKSTADDQISPSHSSAGRPSSSRDQIPNQSSQQKRFAGHEDGAAYDNATGRSYSNQSRRPYANNTGGPSRANDISRGSSRPKHDAKTGHFPNRPPYDGQQSRYDQHAYANSSTADRGSGDYKERSKRPLQSVASTSREVDAEDSSTRERSPKRSRISPSEHGNVDKNATEKRGRETATAATVEADVDVTNVQIDMDRLPHLLVEIAEKNNIDLSDPDALEKIKRHLKSALCSEPTTAAAPVNNGELSQFAAVSDDEDEPSAKVDDQPQLTTGTEDRANLVHEDEQAQSAGQTGVTQSSLAEFFNEELVAHLRGWSAEHFEVQAAHLASASFHISLDVSHISADLKCARSLVRTAEIRSTLLEQRIAYLRQQHHELDTLSKPNASAAVSTSLGSS